MWNYEGKNGEFRTDVIVFRSMKIFEQNLAWKSGSDYYQTICNKYCIIYCKPLIKFTKYDEYSTFRNI